MKFKLEGYEVVFLLGCMVLCLAYMVGLYQQDKRIERMNTEPAIECHAEETEKDKFICE